MEKYPIPSFINTSIVNSTVSKDYYEFCSNKVTSKIKHLVSSNKEINQDVFSELIINGPDEVRKLADITDLLDNFCKQNTFKIPFNGFYSESRTCSWIYKKLIHSIGEINVNCYNTEVGELGIYNSNISTVTKIPCVILINHRYYALTNHLMQWLEVSNKPRRARVLADLFY